MISFSLLFTLLLSTILTFFFGCFCLFPWHGLKNNLIWCAKVAISRWACNFFRRKIAQQPHSLTYFYARMARGN